MTRDVETLRYWIRIVLIIAALGTNSVPLLYFFAPWRSHAIGRFFMLQAVAFAVAMDMSLLFSFWQPKDIRIVFWVNAIVLTGIAVSTSSLTVLMWKANYLQKRGDVVLFNEKTYKFLKFVAQIFLPALGAMYFGLAQIWGLPKAEEIVGTITVIDAFLGVILGLSSNVYNKSDLKYGGAIEVEQHADGMKTFTLEVSGDPQELDQQDEVLFKIKKS